MKKLILLLNILILSNLVFSGPVITLDEGHFDTINKIVKYPFGNYALSCGNDETIFIWDEARNSIVHSIELYKGTLTTIAISPGGQYFVAGNKRGNIFIFDYNSKKLLSSPKLHKGKVSEILFTNKETEFVSGGFDGNIVVYDILQSTIVRGMSMPSKVISMAISNDKKNVAVGDDNGNVYVIPTKDYVSFTTLSGHSDWVTGLVFSPDSKNLATISWDLSMNIIDIGSGQKTKSVQIPTDKPLNSVDWSIDGKLLAVTSSDEKIYIFDGEVFNLQFNLSGHKGQVYTAQFFPSSNKLISGGADAAIKVWDLKTRELIKSYSGY